MAPSSLTDTTIRGFENGGLELFFELKNREKEGGEHLLKIWIKCYKHYIIHDSIISYIIINKLIIFIGLCVGFRMDELSLS